MAKNFLDYAGLTAYDTQLKALLPQPDGVTIVVDKDGKWMAKSAVITTVNANTETLEFSNSEATPAISNETLTF